MEQRSIKSFFPPRDPPTTTTSHKRTASSSLSKKEPATKVSKLSEPLEMAEKISKAASPGISKEDAHARPTTKGLTLDYHKGDIFAAPAQSLLIHACNTQGSWGAGIASAFKARYPAAYKVYREYCIKTHNPATNPVPTGTCLLIPPCETSNGKPKHWIGCLFTSAKYGKAKDTPTVILESTGKAMMHLLELVKGKEADNSGEGFDEIRMCMINSGKFGVPWKRTVEVLEGLAIEENHKDTVEVWSMD